MKIPKNQLKQNQEDIDFLTQNQEEIDCSIACEMEGPTNRDCRQTYMNTNKEKQRIRLMKALGLECNRFELEPYGEEA